MSTYEAYALRYARHERHAAENFLGGDPHDGPMPMDYFVWLVRDANRVFVVDTGFNAAAARRRGRKLLRCPAVFFVVRAYNRIKNVLDSVVGSMMPHAFNAKE